MGLNLQYPDGQTPLDEDEKEGLLVPTIATCGELDEFEQQNIEQAMLWTLRRSVNPQLIPTEDFIRNLHKRMYGDVWAWAGAFRKPIKTSAWISSGYPPRYDSCWMMRSTELKTICFRQMSLPSGLSTAS